MTPAVPSHAQDARRRGFIQCGQCTEEFPRNTLVCRRCNRTNSRSPVIIGLKFLGLVLFVCAVSLLVRTIAGFGRFPTSDEISRAADLAPASAPQADVRF